MVLWRTERTRLQLASVDKYRHSTWRRQQRRLVPCSWLLRGIGSRDLAQIIPRTTSAKFAAHPKLAATKGSNSLTASPAVGIAKLVPPCGSTAGLCVTATMHVLQLPTAKALPLSCICASVALWQVDDERASAETKAAAVGGGVVARTAVTLQQCSQGPCTTAHTADAGN